MDTWFLIKKPKIHNSKQTFSTNNADEIIWLCVEESKYTAQNSTPCRLMISTQTRYTEHNGRESGAIA